MRRSARAWCLAGSLACAACGAQPLMTLPSGPGAPASDAADALQQATGACRGVRTLSMEIAVTGSGGGRRIRGRLLAGVAAPSSARLEALAPFGPPAFILVTTGGDATLLLPRAERVLEHAPPDVVLEAVAGVPLDAANLHAMLTGCAAPPAGVEGRRIGDWRIVRPAGDEAGDASEWYLQRDAAGAWRLMAAVHSPARNAWRVDYGGFQNGLPRSVRIAASDGKRFDIRLALSQVEINMPLGPEVFSVEIPPTAAPISLQELRRSGPWPAPESDGR